MSAPNDRPRRTDGSATAGGAPPPDASAAGDRSAALLAATNRFLRCDDLGALGTAVIDAIEAMFEPAKSAIVLFRPDGGAALVATRGFDQAEREPFMAAVDDPDRMAALLSQTEERWSDDPKSAIFLERLAPFGSRAGFSLPIRTAAGLFGFIGLLYPEPTIFDPETRAAARSLAAQVGLAVELIAARDDLGRNARALELQRQTAAALLAVAADLAGIIDPEQVPSTLTRATRRATGAVYAGVAVRIAGGDTFRLISIDGAPPELAEAARGIELSADRFSGIGEVLAGRVAGGDAQSPAGISSLGLASAIAAPIVIDGATWGLIAIGAGPGNPRPTESWTEVVTGIASLGATAIARAEATAELARQRERLASEVAEQTRALRGAVDELRIANDAKTAFLASVSHELRTPLTAIVGYADLLAAGLDDPLTARQREDARTIQRSSRHLLALIDDLIDISGIEAGAIELRIEPIEVADLLRGVIDELRPRAGEKGLRLELDRVEPGLRVAADPARLRDIVANLVSNAIKFTPARGTVRVEAGSAWNHADTTLHQATPERPLIEIAIVDSGVGVAAEDQERIFEKFERLAGPELPGTGLGLSIARELARAHGGDLVVDSTLGLGSRFSILLPPPDLAPETRPEPRPSR